MATTKILTFNTRETCNERGNNSFSETSQNFERCYLKTGSVNDCMH